MNEAGKEKRSMDMMLNSLPSRTWNRLGINESFVTIEDKLEKYTPATAWAGNTAVFTPFADKKVWAGFDSGMGKDICSVTGDADIAMVETAEGVQMDEPVRLDYIYKNEEKAVSRLKLHAAKNSKLSVIMYLTSEGRNDNGMSVIQTEVEAEEGSKVEIYTVQLLGSGFLCLNDIGGVCEDNASVKVTKLELGAGRLYAGSQLDLKGRESYFGAEVAYHVRRDELVDMNYVALHHGKKTNSLMEVNGTIENGGRKAFRGTIDFQQGCAGSKGTESENVLLMGDEVVNQTIPLILCKEEDVEGNHGASIGKLDEKVLFYMSARGIPEELAQQIIAQSRVDAICEKIPDEAIRTAVHEFEL